MEESVRGCRRVRDPVVRGAGERVAHGAAHHDRRPQARVREAHHRGRAVLPVLPAGQEGPRPRADLRAARRGPLQDRRRRPDHVGRPARRPDPGLLRRARSTTSSRCPCSPSTSSDTVDKTDLVIVLARHGPRARRRRLERHASTCRSRSSTSAATPPSPNQVTRARDRRRGGRQGLPARRRHDRHRRHDRQGRRGAEGRGRDGRHRRGDPRDVLPAGRRAALVRRASTASSSPTRCRCRRRSASTSSRCCRSRRCSPARSTRSSRTAPSPRCSTAPPRPGLHASRGTRGVTRYACIPRVATATARRSGVVGIGTRMRVCSRR